jgi:hypothetical protein
MNDVHFQFMGTNSSYGGFYIGFGVLFTAYLLFSALLAWHLGGLARKNPQTMGPLGWSLFTIHHQNRGHGSAYDTREDGTHPD